LKLALEESVGDNDELIEIEGIKFLIHSNYRPYFQNTKIDFTKGFFGGGQFKIITL
jgi:Fe-S cluster assembly iron-binding protein IscA